MTDYIIIKINKESLANFFTTTLLIIIGLGLGYLIGMGGTWAFESIYENIYNDRFEEGKFMGREEMINEIIGYEKPFNSPNSLIFSNSDGNSRILYFEECPANPNDNLFKFLTVDK